MTVIRDPPLQNGARRHEIPATYCATRSGAHRNAQLAIVASGMVEHSRSSSTPAKNCASVIDSALSSDSSPQSCGQIANGWSRRQPQAPRCLPKGEIHGFREMLTSTRISGQSFSRLRPLHADRCRRGDAGRQTRVLQKPLTSPYMKRPCSRASPRRTKVATQMGTRTSARKRESTRGITRRHRTVKKSYWTDRPASGYWRRNPGAHAYPAPQNAIRRSGGNATAGRRHRAGTSGRLSGRFCRPWRQIRATCRRDSTGISSSVRCLRTFHITRPTIRSVGAAGFHSV